MKINTFIDKIKYYASSYYLILTLALLTYLIWLLPTPVGYVLASIYALLSFLPLLTNEGKTYLPFFILPIIAQKKDISISTISPIMFIMAFVPILSIVLFIIFHKLEFKKGDLMVELMLLIGSMLISFFYNAIKNDFFDTSSLLFIFFMLIECLSYSLICTTIGRDDSFPYLCESICSFSLVITLEIFTFYFKNGFSISPETFTLGWSYTLQSASSLLCMTIPFYGILIYLKKWPWIIGEIFVLASVFILSTDSSLLSLLFAFIPLILLSFRSYGKLYSYISMITIISIGTTIVLMLVFNKQFSNRLLEALKSLNLFHEEGMRKTMFENAISSFFSNPYVGTSITTFSNGNNTFVFASNTILTIMVNSGSFGLFFYFLYELKLYVTAIRKDTPNKWIYLVFLLLFEMIGLIDNTFFNLGIFELFLISQAAYEMSNKKDDVIIHDSYYKNYRKRQNSLT